MLCNIIKLANAFRLNPQADNCRFINKKCTFLQFFFKVFEYVVYL